MKKKLFFIIIIIIIIIFHSNFLFCLVKDNWWHEYIYNKHKDFNYEGIIFIGKKDIFIEYFYNKLNLCFSLMCNVWELYEKNSINYLLEDKESIINIEVFYNKLNIEGYCTREKIVINLNYNDVIKLMNFYMFYKQWISSDLSSTSLPFNYEYFKTINNSDHLWVWSVQMFNFIEVKTESKDVLDIYFFLLNKKIEEIGNLFNYDNLYIIWYETIIEYNKNVFYKNNEDFINFVNKN